MPKPLTVLSEVQRTQANACFAIIHPALEEGVTQAQVARNHDLPKSTVQRWIKNYREKGLAGLANASRSGKGKSRNLPDQVVGLIEGLSDHSPPRSATSIHHQVVEISTEQGWKPSSSARKRQIIKNLDPALVTLARLTFPSLYESALSRRSKI